MKKELEEMYLDDLEKIAAEYVKCANSELLDEESKLYIELLDCLNEEQKIKFFKYETLNEQNTDFYSECIYKFALKKGIAILK